MNTTELKKDKNAPLAMPVDRHDFVSWASSEPDGFVTAGWQPLDPRLTVEVGQEMLRASGAKLVSLARRELNRTPEQVAASAGVRLVDVLALEHGEDVAADTVGRVAAVLQLNAEVLVQLFGLRAIVDASLVAAALEFIARLESAAPLDPREAQALGWFRSNVVNRRGRVPV